MDTLEVVEVSITVCCVNTILTCRLGLLCAVNSHSIKAATTFSEECSGLSPYKSDNKWMFMHFEEGDSSEIEKNDP